MYICMFNLLACKYVLLDNITGAIFSGLNARISGYCHFLLVFRSLDVHFLLVFSASWYDKLWNDRVALTM
jgi:hypothetical protein